MSNRIKNPYSFNPVEVELIKDNFTSYKDWSKTVFDSLKEKIIEHLRKEQNNKCCYCKNELGYDIKSVDIEHIIPKSEYSDFTFHNLNLALSCPGCNTKKSTKSVLNKKVKKYPADGDPFVIVHAHFDEYDNHIINKEECIYIARTSKGSDTIKFCELFRFLEILERSKKKITEKSVLSKLVEEIRTGDSDKINELKALLNN